MYVFAFPATLIFDKPKLEQILLICNPYNVSVDFKILSNTPEKFIVSLSKGTIPSKHRVETTIRLKETYKEPSKYWFRVDFYSLQDRERKLGSTTIPAKCHLTEPEDDAQATRETPADSQDRTPAPPPRQSPLAVVAGRFFMPGTITVSYTVAAAVGLALSFCLTLINYIYRNGITDFFN
eukprot:m.28427 g.28427  ORF g.28427 m.28427 type:complete len:180 (+) comp30768_c0_seq2:135-674(+)